MPIIKEDNEYIRHRNINGITNKFLTIYQFSPAGIDSEPIHIVCAHT